MLYFLLPGIAIVIYFLYRRGLMISKSICAILFVFRPGQRQDTARLRSCTGWVRYAGRFHESRTYQFALECQLSKGSVEVVLLDRKKRILLWLNQASPSGSVELDEKGRYDLRWKFCSATGRCKLLHW